MRLPKRWLYSLFLFPKAAFRLPYWVIQSLAVALDSPRTHNGIVIANLMPGQRKESFVSTTVAALDLIQATDRLRFARVQREIRFIIQTIVASPAQYRRLSRTCSVDLRHFPFYEFPDFSLKAYACVLVHEATHGYLHSKGVPHIVRLRPRIEKICTIEAIRFAKKFQDSSYDWRKNLWDVYTDGQGHPTATLKERGRYLKWRLSQED